MEIDKLRPRKDENMQENEKNNVNSQYEIIRMFGEKSIQDIIKGTIIKSMRVTEDNWQIGCKSVIIYR